MWAAWARATLQVDGGEEATELVRSDGQEKIALSLGGALGGGGGSKAKLALPKGAATFVDEEAAGGGGAGGRSAGGGGSGGGGSSGTSGGGGGAFGKKPMSAIEALMVEETKRKEKAEAAKAQAAGESAAAAAVAEVRTAYWMPAGLIISFTPPHSHGPIHTVPFTPSRSHLWVPARPPACSLPLSRR